jgi:hypothetical protein
MPFSLNNYEIMDQAEALLTIDSINGQTSNVSLELTGRTVKFTGWAADIQNRAVFSNVLVKMSSHYYPCLIKARQDVADHFYMDEILQSGIEVNIPKDEFVEGENQLEFIFIPETDRREYYKSAVVCNVKSIG